MLRVSFLSAPRRDLSERTIKALICILLLRTCRNRWGAREGGREGGSSGDNKTEEKAKPSVHLHTQSCGKDKRRSEALQTGGSSYPCLLILSSARLDRRHAAQQRRIVGGGGQKKIPARQLALTRLSTRNPPSPRGVSIIPQNSQRRADTHACVRRRKKRTEKEQKHAWNWFHRSETWRSLSRGFQLPPLE